MYSLSNFALDSWVFSYLCQAVKYLLFFISSYSADFKTLATLYLKSDVSQPVFHFASVQHLAKIIPHQFDSNLIQCLRLLSSTYSASQLLKVYSQRSPNCILPLFSSVLSHEEWHMPDLANSSSYISFSNLYFQHRIESKSTEIKVKRLFMFYVWQHKHD